MGEAHSRRSRVGPKKQPRTMPKIAYYRNYGKTFKKPRRPFEKERLDSEMKIVGEYGLRNKRELWRIQLVLSKLRKTARELLTLPEDDPKRIFDANALERRLQTLVFKLGLAKSIHHARILIKQRHIRVG